MTKLMGVVVVLAVGAALLRRILASVSRAVLLSDAHEVELAVHLLAALVGFELVAELLLKRLRLRRQQLPRVARRRAPLNITTTSGVGSHLRLSWD